MRREQVEGPDSARRGRLAAALRWLGEMKEMASKPKTHGERAAARRQEKLEHMQQQIEAGTLTVRQMTPAERERHPRPAKPPPRRRWR
jgi:hypothetical protein